MVDGTLSLKAGVGININVQFNFAAAEMASDWSVIAKGKDGTLTLTHTGDLQSDTLPVLNSGDAPTP